MKRGRTLFDWVLIILGGLLIVKGLVIAAILLASR